MPGAPAKPPSLFIIFLVALFLTLPGAILFGDTLSEDAVSADAVSEDSLSEDDLSEDAADNRPVLPVIYYGDINCSHCDTVVDGLIPALEEFYGVTVSVEAYDIMQRVREEEVRQRLSAMDLSYRTFPVLLVGNNAYQGNYAIDTHLPEEIEYFLWHGDPRSFDHTASETRHPGAASAGSASAASASASAAASAPEGPSSPGDPGVLRYFWGVGCPYCELAAPFIDSLERRYPGIRVERYEVFQTREHHDTFRETLAWYGSTSTGVPQIFFESNGWVGYSENIARQVEEAIEGSPRVGSTESLELPFFGTIQTGNVPAVVITAAIAFVDGFNPCSLWVLTLLLGLIAHTRSRRRIMLVGSVFLTVTAAIYGLFMLGLLSVFALAGNTMTLRILVGVIAVVMGMINVKDFLFFKRGISLTIPERFQGFITTGSRVVASATSTGLGLAAMTAVFAAGIAIVELPCTAGFPVIWSRYITSTVSSRGAFYSLLGLYLLIYLLLEILIVAAALFTMGRIEFNQRQARPIKLVGGAIMVSLGVFYVIDPEIAGSLAGVGRIFLAALLGAALIAGVNRIIARRSPRKRPGRADR